MPLKTILLLPGQYMVYISDSGEVVYDYMSPKSLLAGIRRLCQNMLEPDMNLCQAYNSETKDGSEMYKYTELLQKAMQSILQTKNKNDIKGLFSKEPTSILDTKMSDTEDFVIVSFIVVKGNHNA